MNFQTSKRIIKLGFTNFWRNRWLSFSAALILSLTLITISIFVIFNIVINTTAKNIKEKIDISVYFYDLATEEQIDIIKSQVKNLPKVINTEYISKDQALKIWNERSGNEKIKQLVTPENNPLPRSLEIKASDPEHLESIANFLLKDDYKDIIRKVDYSENKEVIEKLNNTISFSKKIGIILSLIFAVISILVILNTIKLTILTRKDEIGIMRLVGASDVFIKVPFFIESVLYGLLACLISLIVIGVGLKLLTPFMIKYLGEVNLNLTGFFLENLIIIGLLQLVIGVVLSIVCTFISIGKYLKT